MTPIRTNAQRIVWLNDKATKDGPSETDYQGELSSPVKVCWGCRHMGIHDSHYAYCSAQEAQNQSPTKEYVYPWRGAGKHLHTGPDADNCPYILEES